MNKTDKRTKSFTIEGKKYTVTDLYIKYVTKYGYDYGRENIRRMICGRLKKDAKGHRKHILENIIAK